MIDFFKKIFKKENNKKKSVRRKGKSSFQLIIAGFLIIIFIGACLLSLPISSQSREFTRFDDSLFTAVSATCVTGLVVRDTATYWSMFGQFVILILIQIGGMGVITVGFAVLYASGKKISISQRSTMQDSISAPRIGGIVQLTGFILKGSAIIELSGAAFLMPMFCYDFGFFKGLWYSIFHSISAFCNAGFDLMGVRAPFSSLTSYNGNVYVNIIIMLLIIIGGIGFLTWNDVITHRTHFKKYSLQSKIILTTSLVLILIPAILFFLFEYSDLSFKDRILSSFFQSVTARTAGFNSTDLAQMNGSGTMIMIFLMLIGGAPGSTAGGMKTTTFAVLFLAAISVFTRKNDVQCYRRRLDEDTVRSAGAILFIYLMLFLAGALIISTIEDLPLLTCLFEAASAIGTVGLTLGITTSLSFFSKMIIIFLMFFGRVGALTLVYAAFSTNENKMAKLPLERVTVG